MKVGERFQALSLDLGETVWWDTPAHGVRHDETRTDILSKCLVDREGNRVPPQRIAVAMKALRAELQGAGRSYRSLSTPHKIVALAERTSSRLTVPLDDAVERFAYAGLDSDPPTLNPEALELVTALNRRGIPVVAISNTQRTGKAWHDFLQRAGMEFRFVVTSSDREYSKPDPRLFQEVSERIGLPPAQILHVGDRWETDVLGALSVGMGAALYRGLWSRQWDRSEGASSDPGTHPEVPRWDDLRQAELVLLPELSGSSPA